MKLDELLLEIDNIATINGLSKPFIVGGVPRDRIIGLRDKVENIKDFDITTGTKDSIKLGILVNKSLRGSIYRTYDDGHTSVDYLGVHFDFSSNFIVPGIKNELLKTGIKNIDDMKLEMYSRDFTMNTLLESLDFKSIYDITGNGIKDIQAKLIRCPVDPEITIGTDPRRILRAIKFSIKYNFNIENKLKTAIINNRKKIQELPKKFLQDKANEIVLLDAQKGIDLLIEFKILPLIPLTKTLSDILIQNRKLIRAL